MSRSRNIIDADTDPGNSGPGTLLIIPEPQIMYADPALCLL
jgi:hypothetical protein